MSQDHYVAQSYLRKWCDPKNRDHMHAYRKSDLKYFPAHPYTVCRERDGDKIAGWLDDELALGKFRAMFEPDWNRVVLAASERRLTMEDKFLLSGYWANLLATTPAAQALGIEFFKSKAEVFAAQKEDEGPTGSSAQFDSHFIKAAATDSMPYFVWQLYNLSWRLLFNDTPHPFLTSDHPSSILESAAGQGIFRFLPLTPHLCILTLVSESPDPPEVMPSPPPPPKGDIRYRAAGKIEVKEINRAIVMNAHDLVFTIKADAGIARLVKNKRGYALRTFGVANEKGVFEVRGMHVARRTAAVK